MQKQIQRYLWTPSVNLQITWRIYDMYIIYTYIYIANRWRCWIILLRIFTKSWRQPMKSCQKYMKSLRKWNKSLRKSMQSLRASVLFNMVMDVNYFLEKLFGFLISTFIDFFTDSVSLFLEIPHTCSTNSWISLRLSEMSFRVSVISLKISYMFIGVSFNIRTDFTLLFFRFLKKSLWIPFISVRTSCIPLLLHSQICPRISYISSRDIFK